MFNHGVHFSGVMQGFTCRPFTQIQPLLCGSSNDGTCRTFILSPSHFIRNGETLVKISLEGFSLHFHKRYLFFDTVLTMGKQSGTSFVTSAKPTAFSVSRAVFSLFYLLLVGAFNYTSVDPKQFRVSKFRMKPMILIAECFCSKCGHTNQHPPPT